MNAPKPILTITGSDSTGGSGIQADIRAISELGGCAATAVTSVTVQTTLGIQEFYDLPAAIVGGQIEAVMNDVQPEVVKIGMIRTLDTLAVVVDALKRYRPRHVIYDAVATSSSGEELVPQEVLREIERQLLPLCTQVVRLDGRLEHGQANRYASELAVKLNSEGQGRYSTERGVGRAAGLHREFLRLLEEDYRHNSDVHHYADCMNVSARYLAQVTRRISGQSPKAIIDERLTREIERLLTTTERTVQEIAYSCGFLSQAHLTKFFKKQRGMSPTGYRKVKR